MKTIKNIILGPRIRLVRFENKHLTQKYISWLNDPEVVKFSEQRHMNHTKSSCIKYIRDKQKNGLNLFLAIELIDSEEHIGNIGVDIDPYNKMGEPSILIGEKKYWNNKFGFEAWSLIINYLFEIENLRVIVAGTMENNYAMQNIFKKIGMEFNCIKKNKFLYNNEYLGEYSVFYLRENYQKKSFI